MTRDKEYDKMHKRIRNQRRALRVLNAYIRERNVYYEKMYERNQILIKQLNDRMKVTVPARVITDYRSSCKCWICRLREWYRFRSGETYPGNKGWRFPFKGYWPYWR